MIHWATNDQVPSLLSSKKGVANRGIEFEVKFIWSITSGKHELHMNNICVSSSTMNHSPHLQQRSTNKFDQTFNIPQSILPGGHILHLTLWNMNFNKDQVDQLYTLRLDGQKYVEFAKIFELGHPDMMNKYNHAFYKLRTNTSTATDSHSNNHDSHSNQQYSNASTNNNNTNYDQREPQPDSLVRGRPRYQPKIKTMNKDMNLNNNTRVRSNTADNGILAPERNSYYNGDDAQHVLNTSASDDIDHYWERRPPVLPTTIIHRKASSMSPKQRKRNILRRDNNYAYNNNNNNQNNVYNSNNHQYSNQHQPWNNNLNKKDFASNDIQEKEYIAKAKLNSFRDLRGEEQSYDKNQNNYNPYESRNNNIQVEESSIPTFARPPRSNTLNKTKIKVHLSPSRFNNNNNNNSSNNSSNNNNIHRNIQNNNQNNNQPHLQAVQETTLVPDLLDDNNNKPNVTNTTTSPKNSGMRSSISFPTLVRSTSDITMDTMLRDMGKDADGMSVVTEQYPHLDPKQMLHTQKHINFRLQNPPVYADSSAGDLIQPAPVPVSTTTTSGQQQPQNNVMSSSNNKNNSSSSNKGTMNYNSTNGINTPVTGAYQPMSFGQQQKWKCQQNLPSQQQQQSNPLQYQYNTVNFAGRHMHVPVPQQPVGFNPSPAPTWDSLHDAFLNTTR